MRKDSGNLSIKWTFEFIDSEGEWVDNDVNLLVEYDYSKSGDETDISNILITGEGKSYDIESDFAEDDVSIIYGRIFERIEHDLYYNYEEI